MEILRKLCIVATFINIPAIIMWLAMLKISLDEYRDANCLDKCRVSSFSILIDMWFAISTLFFEVIFIVGWCLL